MQLSTLNISTEEFDLLRKFQGRARSDCHAAFSVVRDSSISPFASLGNTPEEYKEIDLRNHSAFKVLEQIANEYLSVRPEGGRFFIDKGGAFYRPGKTNIRFLRFDFIEDAPLA